MRKVQESAADRLWKEKAEAGSFRADIVFMGIIVVLLLIGS
jgi:hypothetical protein